MSAKEKKKPAAEGADEATIEALTATIQAGAGLPAVARAASAVLGASVALIDRSFAFR